MSRTKGQDPVALGCRYEQRRATEIGHGLLWDAAGLLQVEDTRAASTALIAREALMLRLVDQAAKFNHGLR
ncbi:hypothetical protein [Streptomyces sp. NBC_01462]|uniref:hypothetical protein n=1 Tax=Streptomyces sp. NBC_01462 TaxID=2903876 RepID=UPI002E31CCF6|nr:hypothetical protein [Streptomyces sp. NBC_01462]